jgi:hypothetical protein
MKCIGDYACQHLFEKTDSPTSIESCSTENENCACWKWDSDRSWRLGMIRATIAAPFMHLYYPWLSRMVPGSTWIRVFGRVMLDQAVGSPIAISIVFFGSAFYEGRPLEEGFERIKLRGSDAWLAGLMYWPFVHSFNFRYLPLSSQPMFAHLMSTYWNAILSYYNEKGKEEDKGQQEKR